MREPSVAELGLPEAEGSAGSWFGSVQTQLGHPKTGDPEWRNGHWGAPRQAQPERSSSTIPPHRTNPACFNSAWDWCTDKSQIIKVPPQPMEWTSHLAGAEQTHHCMHTINPACTHSAALCTQLLKSSNHLHLPMFYKSKTRQRNTKLNYESSTFFLLPQKFHRYIIVKDAEKVLSQEHP